MQAKNTGQAESAQKEQWPDRAAKKVIEEKGNLLEYTVAAGITPSGVVHIGNFREIITVDLVARALRRLGKKVRFIYSWDDYDVFRKIPANFPGKEMLEKYLRQPIVDVPDPFGCHKSYAEHNEKALEEELPSMGVSPVFLHQAKKYRACEYAEGMRKALLAKDKIKAILDKWRAEGLEGNWNPVRVFCSKCNTDRTDVTGYDGAYSLTYSCECGFAETFDFRKKGIAKLQWRVDWPMRWAHEKVMFEPSGKEHSSEGGSNTTANEIARTVYGFEPPYHVMYEFIAIKGTGGKMSSSKGNTVDLKEMKSVYEPSIIRYLFVRPIPSKAFEVSFDGDVITIYEAFDRLERVYFGSEQAKPEELEQLRSIYEYSAVEIPESMPFQPSFRHVTTVLQLNLMDEAKAHAYFTAMAKTAFDHARLRTRISCAKHWLENYAPPQFVFRVQDSASEAAVSMPRLHKDALLGFSVSLRAGMDEDSISAAFKKAAESHSIKVADLFRSAYLMLLDRERGPRLFQVIENIGPEKVMALAQELNSKMPAQRKVHSIAGIGALRKLLDFGVSGDIRSKFPGLRIGVVLVEGADNSSKNPEIAGLLRVGEARFRELHFGRDLASIKTIKSWREAYSSFGAKPKESRSSIEAIAKRVLKGDQLPSINALVDIYNYISIKYVLPVGGEDVSRLKGPLRLRYADGGEPFSRIGSSDNEPAEKGEVIYADDEGAVCRRFNWREADRTKLVEGTQNAVIFVESLSADEPLEEALEELALLIKRFCPCKVSTFIA
ncbi:MAG: lysine--tRNA ligase [Candidatus Diapherotrites archaeon]|uniref:Lysine--tRNA ligase n=1 Tax=Candidatus Iainarchaeum sp. TaxID=3101447 RepID=A0A8T3YL29_9ARCH|nr:lysine--tRNA ligase [Candidatus Diapherotrites archaeon]